MTAKDSILARIFERTPILGRDFIASMCKLNPAFASCQLMVLELEDLRRFRDV